MNFYSNNQKHNKLAFFADFIHKPVHISMASEVSESSSKSGSGINNPLFTHTPYNYRNKSTDKQMGTKT